MEGISRDTFEEMETDSKLNVLFDYAKEQISTCRKCTDKIERQGKVNVGAAAAMGFVGGFVGFLSKTFLGK